ncbi:hypothetical protein [Escherichia coli]|uniref:hypothetical protein n=1 Tax=Escherichia coli TaxID=562 RepID=UPI003EEF8139
MYTLQIRNIILLKSVLTKMRVLHKLGAAESEQTIALTAYMKATGRADNVKAGVVDAIGIMTIKAAAAAADAGA